MGGGLPPRPQEESPADRVATVSETCPVGQALSPRLSLTVTL